MGCCSSKTNAPNKTHPLNVDTQQLTAITSIAQNGNESQVDHTASNGDNTENEQDTLDQFIQRQKQFELKLKQQCANQDNEATSCSPSAYIDKSRRVIKPFLSSTFRDFFAEREYLFKKCFPFIEKQCTDKGLNFIPIDLRWGVTVNQCNSGQVIKICLDEIDECRPYFLCFLGFRNGWSLIDGNENDALLIKTFDFAAKFYPWVYEYKHKSVTELEILHGVLRQQDDEKLANLRCIFYLKSVEYLQRQINAAGNDSKQSKSFIDFDQAEQNLMQLKEKVVRLKHCKIRWFNSCEQLSNQVQTDLSRFIELDFPVAAIDNEARKEMYQHELYRYLLTNKIYIDVNSISVKLHRFVFKNNAQNILLISGDSGIGKSTVLAYFDKQQREENTATAPTQNTSMKEKMIIISRYIGITLQSNSILSLLKSIINELYELYPDLKQEISDKPNQQQYDENDMYDAMDYLYQSLEKVVNIYSPPLILLLFESVNQFSSKTQELEFLNMIMNTIGNPRIKVIMSTSNMQMAQKQMQKSGIKVDHVVLDKMNEDEIVMFIKHYMSQYGKVFDEKQKSMILQNESVSNPLFLSIFLEEMRCFGSFENLNEYISSYIKVASISELFDKVMQRLDVEFNEGCDRLLIHVLCLLYMSRDGLLPNELQLCLEHIMNVSKVEKTFPIFEYSSLLHQLNQLHFIKQISGRYVIIHDFVRQLIQCKYFDDTAKENEDAAVKYLQAIYKSFTTLYKMDRYSNARFVHQVPYCLYLLIADYQRDELKSKLQQIIQDIECIQYMKLAENMYDFHKYWNTVQNGEDAQIDKCFKRELNRLVFEKQCSEQQIAQYYRDIAIFMIDTGRYYNDIEYFLKKSLAYYSETGAVVQIESITFELAKLYQKQHKFEQALTAYKKCVSLLQQYLAENNDKTDKETQLKLLIRQSAMAGIQKELNEWDEAIKNYQYCLEYKTKILDANNPLIAIDMINIANIYILSTSEKEKYLKKAEELACSAKNIFENNFGSDCLQLSMVYSLLGYIYQHREKYNLAIQYLKHSKTIKVAKLGATNIDIVQSLNNLGNVYMKIGDTEQALQHFEDAYQLMIDYHPEDKNKLILCHTNLSNYYLSNRKFELALQHLIECKDAIIETYGAEHIKIIRPLLHLANIYNETIKDYERAQNLYEQILRIVESKDAALHSFVDVKLECLHGLAHIYLHHYKQTEKSFEFLDKQLQILLTQHPNSGHTTAKKIDVLQDKVAVYLNGKNYVKAWETLEGILTLFESVDSEHAAETLREKLVTTYNICGNVMFQLNRQSDAVYYYEQQVKLMEESDDGQRDLDRYVDVIQLLAIIHFGNQHLEQSKRYFHAYMKICDENKREYDKEEMRMWLDDIGQAELLVTA